MRSTPGSPSAASAHAKGVALLIASMLAWSTAGLLVRFIHIDALSTLLWRGPAGGLALVAFMIWRLGPRETLAGFLRLGGPGWAYAALSTLGMLTFIPALQYSSVAHVAIVYATVPFVAAAAAFLLLGERPSTAALVASLVALVGVGIMTIGGADAKSSLFGDLLAAVMTVATATMMALGRRYPRTPFLHAAALSGFLIALTAAPLVSQLPPTAEQYVVISASGVINTALGLGLFVLGSPLVPAIETALIGALEGPLAPLWVWLVLGETPAVQTLIGGAIVTAAVLGHLWRERGAPP